MINSKKFNSLISESLFDVDDKKVTQVLHWISHQNDSIQVAIEKKPIEKLSKWRIDQYSIYHESNAFFKIENIEVQSSFHNQRWTQPIINQNEIGFLGIVSKIVNKKLKFLIQAKVEPGNVNYVQLSPTLQATYSNFTLKHNGNPPKFLSIFQKAKNSTIIIDRLYSEQGARFLKKRNRNIIIYTEDDLEIPENFIWLTLGEIKKLMEFENIVNMDTRTVISSIDLRHFEIDNPFKNNTINYHLFNSYTTTNNSLKALNTISRKIFDYKIDVSKISFKNNEDWVFQNGEFINIDKKYFKVIGAEISISNREVISWNQPLIEPLHKGICFLYIKLINNTLLAACKIISECGHRDIVEIGPTIQNSDLNGFLKNHNNEAKLLNDCNNHPSGIFKKVFQSEEGGRFYKEQNLNYIYIDLNNEINIIDEDRYQWLTLNDLITLNLYSSNLNIQLRSLLSMINFK